MDDANRRLAGILAADVVGYSAMVGTDEPATLARVRTLRTDIIDPVAAEHGGRLFKTTGDGFLAAFASAMQALRCAIAIQERLRAEPDGLRLRIGVHQGEVVAEGDDLLGDGVIIATRLEPLAEPGGICISGRVREDAAGKIALEVDDLGTPELKNIAAKVHVFRVRIGTPERPALPLPDKPSIAVLAFTNMSGDPEQEYFSDGIADDIITELSRNHSLFVIARNSSFTHRGRAVDIRQVARELGVRYVLEGSVRRGGERVRVNAQLIDAETGNHIWAERYDRDLAEMFAVQDEITLAVTRAIGTVVAVAEQRRALRRPHRSLTAWEAYQRGLWHLMKYSVDHLAPRANSLTARLNSIQRLHRLTRSWHASTLWKAAAMDCVRLKKPGSWKQSRLEWPSVLTPTTPTHRGCLPSPYSSVRRSSLHCTTLGLLYRSVQVVRWRI
jgi:adenylate cyclase